jgi:predicted phage tail component-like protein
MAFGFTYDNTHSSTKGIIVRNVQRDILPEVSSRTITIPGRPGVYYSGAEYGAREIRVEIVLSGESFSDIRAKVRDIAGWLKPDGIKSLVFDDEPDKTYLAVLSEGSEIEEIVYTGKGEITFICPDPYAFGAVRKQVIEAPNPTFSRSSVAYKQDGTQVAADVPRFEPGKFGQAVMVEEGTTNELLNTDIEGTLGSAPTSFLAPAGNSRVVSNDLPGIGPNGLVAKHTRNPSSTTDSNIGYQMVVNLPVNTAITASVWVYIPSTTVVTKVVLSLEGKGIASVSASADLTKRDQWQRVVVSGITDADGGDVSAVLRVDTSVDGQVIYSDCWQLERKPYATTWHKTTSSTATRSPETLTIPTAGVLSPQEGTVECWVYVNDLIKRTDGVYRVIWYALPVGGTANGWLVLDHYGNSANWRIAVKNGSTSATYSISDSYTPNGWHLFSLTYNKSDGSIRLLIDGVLRFSRTGAPLPSSYDKMFVGLDPDGTRHCDTLIDDLRISSRARTDTEIAAAYQSNAPLSADADTTYLVHFDDTLAVTNDTTVTNSGTYKTYPVVTVKFTASASEYKITGPNGDYVRVVTSFAAGDELVIDFDKHYVTLNGVSAMPYLDWKNSKFFELQPGDNNLTCTPDNVALVTTTWKPRWL